ncbi:MAG TPA: trypsin-like peptidase domain-containing protein [Symbiobacteriaceae bacterium]|nr:trypsin-like peptidase domain-containing protein [Symbiobacteriaceae bacterium]
MLDDKDKEYNQEEQVNQPSADATPAAETQLAETQPALAADPMMELPEIPAGAAPEAAAGPPAAEYAPPRPANRGWKLFAAALALVATGAGVGSATTWTLAQKYQSASTPIGYVQQSNLKPVAQTTAELAASVVPDIYKQIAPSTVKIDTTVQRGNLRGGGSGSGFVVDSSGYILTNHHVVDGATTIKVKFLDGTVLDGKVIGSDPLKDIALVKVDPGTRGLVPAPLGDSDTVEVGELAVAIGSPFGQEWTVTSGIVSAVNRTLREDEASPWTIPGGIQTDAAINPGNSGGPLLNALGEVIGINTMIETGTSGVRGNLGIGFAVPINLAKEILPTLKAGKAVEYAFLGVGSETLDAATANQLGLSITEGAVVTSVQQGSAAEKAGLQEPGILGRRVISADVIVAIDGKAVKSTEDVFSAIQARKPGDTITISVVRGTETVELKATLGSRTLESN